MKQTKSPGGLPPGVRQFGWVALILVILLTVLFWDGFRPGRTVFSNDGPLGIISAKNSDPQAAYTGVWQDLNWVGLPGLSALPTVPNTLSLLVGPLLFSKIFAPSALLFVGLCAWFCFRQLKFTPLACFLGGIATTLNIDNVSTASWGVAAQVLGFGLFFLAIAALADTDSPRRWIRALLGGFAVGMGVMEAFDIGAIFSLFVAAFVVCQALAGEGPLVKKLVAGGTRLALVAAFAGFTAIAALSTLIGTQVKGVAGMAQDAESKAQRWNEATWISLPKKETLSLFIAGVYGYRMDTPDGGNYWGEAGRSVEWDRYLASGKQGQPPGGFFRYGGGGGYLGITVALIAVWALFQSFRKQDSAFTPKERKLIWFWGGVVLVALLLGWGRYAPFYQLFYALPYASTIRLPAKFIHVLQWAMLILFAYGVHGLSRRYLDATVTAVRDLPSQWKAWWAKAAGFDRKWVLGSLAFFGVSVLGWIAYAANQKKLEAYLAEMLRLELLGRGQQLDPATGEAMARATASFSVAHVGWFVLFLMLGVGLCALVMSGYFNGKRAKIGGVLLGLLLVVDLGRVAPPWVITYDYREKYLEAGDNPVIGFLRQKPFENRVALLRIPWQIPQLAFFNDVYTGEWLHHLFPYYNIQSLDVVMMPRPPVEYVAFESAMMWDSTQPETTARRISRRWQLANTRYLLGPAGFADLLNQKIDPQGRFKVHMLFELFQAKPGGPILTRTNANGPFAIFEFTGALPRAKLFTHWQVSTNDDATLKTLESPAFDPLQTVLVADPILPPATTNAPAGAVEFVSYLPKHVVLRAKAEAAAILLLNDKHDPNWKVTVDGKPAILLRCNYVMRGVELSKGEHTVEFHYSVPVNALYLTLAAMALAFGLIGYLAVTGRRGAKESPTAKPK